MASSRKSLIIGMVLGVVGLLLLEAAGIYAFGRYYRKTPEEVAQDLQPPPIPSSIEAQYELELQDIDGDTIPLADMKDSVVFLTFWKPDCVSCKAQLPSIQRLFEKVDKDGVQFVLAAFGDSADDAFMVADQNHVTAPVYACKGELPSIYKSRATPVAFILSPEGKVAFRHQGPAQWDDEAVVSFLRSLGHHEDAQ